jgi:diketogulonate reductase-like aldo/keto reductase
MADARGVTMIESSDLRMTRVPLNLAAGGIAREDIFVTTKLWRVGIVNSS